MTMRDRLRAGVGAALREAGVSEAAEFSVERPRRASLGDWSSNAALTCASSAGTAPRRLAEQIAASMRADPPAHVEAVEVAGPGFVNFRLAPSWLHEVLTEVVSATSDGYARSDVGAGRTVSVEFVSANPTGPLHAGHGRWAVYGDAVCRLLERGGYRVLREFYVNDRGGQIDRFAASLEQARSDSDSSESGGYRGDYIAEWAAEMPADADVRQWGLRRARHDQTETLDAMGVTFDLYTSEAELVARGAMDDILEELHRRGVVYKLDGALLLRSSDFGDAEDRVVVKSNGEPTYFLPDIAYHHEKFGRGDTVIDVLGADHHSYVPRMRAALAALGLDIDAYEARVGQVVNLRRGGESVRMGKRSGGMVLMSDLLDSVGADITRLVYLLQSIDTTLSIDLDALSAQSSENPVYYLQYAHARIRSLGRQAAARGVERVPLAEADLSVLCGERELDVLRTLADLPDITLSAMQARAPHQITAWARNHAATFHRFWHDCPILSSETDENLRQARLWLVEAARTGLAVALDILGVSAPERLAPVDEPAAEAASSR